jgi:hypothetical protein
MGRNMSDDEEDEDESWPRHWGYDPVVNSEYDAMLVKVQRDLQQLSVGGSVGFARTSAGCWATVDDWVWWAAGRCGCSIGGSVLGRMSSVHSRWVRRHTGDAGAEWTSTAAMAGTESDAVGVRWACMPCHRPTRTQTCVPSPAGFRFRRE